MNYKQQMIDWYDSHTKRGLMLPDDKKLLGEEAKDRKVFVEDKTKPSYDAYMSERVARRLETSAILNNRKPLQYPKEEPEVKQHAPVHAKPAHVGQWREMFEPKAGDVSDVTRPRTQSQKPAAGAGNAGTRATAKAKPRASTVPRTISFPYSDIRMKAIDENHVQFSTMRVHLQSMSWTRHRCPLV